MTIFTSSRATSSPTARETTLGTRLNSTKVMRKIGTKKPKPLLVTPTTSQVLVFLDTKHMPHLLKSSQFQTVTVSTAELKLLVLKRAGFPMGQGLAFLSLSQLVILTMDARPRRQQLHLCNLKTVRIPVFPASSQVS